MNKNARHSVLDTESNIPKLRFPEFVNDGEWEEKFIEDFFNVGSSKRVLQEEWTNQGIPFYRTRELVSLSNNEPFGSEIFISEELFLELAEKYGIPSAGDFLISGVGTLGVCYQVQNDDKFYFKDGNVIWFKLLKDLYSNYFKYCFQSEHIQKQILAQSSASTVGTYTIQNAKKTKFWYPPTFNEQQKIADCLISVDSLILAQSQKVELLKEHKKGLLQNLFPTDGENIPRLRFPEFVNDGEWEEKESGNLFNFLRGSVFSKADIIENGLNKCIHYGELFTIYKERITEIKSYTNIENGQFSQKNDILMPSSDVTPEGLATASAIFEDGIIIGGDVNLLRPKKEVNSLFVSYFLNLSKKEIMKLVSGTTVKHIYNKDISKLSIKLPSFNEQQKIANCLSSLDEQISQQTSKLQTLKEHKKALMQQIFSNNKETTNE